MELERQQDSDAPKGGGGWRGAADPTGRIVDLPEGVRYDPATSMISSATHGSGGSGAGVSAAAAADAMDEEAAHQPNNGTATATATATTMTAGTAPSVTYVDYVPIPAAASAPILPPAKYKLWLCTWSLVYSCVTMSKKSGIVPALQFGGLLTQATAVFLQMNIIVGLLTFAALDVLVWLFTFRINNRTYGLEAWMKASRTQWIHRHGGNVLVELIGVFVTVLEEGFEIFNPPPLYGPQKDADGTNKEKQLYMKQPLPCAGANRNNNNNNNNINNNNDDNKINGDSSPTTPPRHVKLKIEHRVKPECVEQYREWTDKITRLVVRQPGLVRCIREHPSATRRPSRRDRNRTANGTEGEGDEVATAAANGAAKHVVSDGDDDAAADTATTATGADGCCGRVVYVVFESLEALNDWMTSPVRQALVEELRPLLATEGVHRLVRRRNLPDAFTDLLVRQGEPVPKRAPKKWKVYWLTACALFGTSTVLNMVFPYYVEYWNLEDADENLAWLVESLIIVWFVSFVSQPLLMMVFSEWIRRKPHENDQHEPWRTLNDGVGSMRIKIVLTLSYFAGTGIKWAISGPAQ